MGLAQLFRAGKRPSEVADLIAAMPLQSPFLVLALPRSRTAWLSRFLTYDGWSCGHEQARFLREPRDLPAWLSQPFTGSAETSVARWWRLIRAVAPELRVVVIRRPLEDVVGSLMRVDLGGAGVFDRERLFLAMKKIDLALDRIERAPNVRSYEYGALDDEAVCSEIFEFCLGLPHDHEWWAALSPMRITCDMAAIMRYTRAFAPQMIAASHFCLREMRKLRPGFWKPVVLSSREDGIIIQEERLATFWRDGQGLFREHCLAVGEEEDQYLRKNLQLIGQLEEAGRWQFVTARCNGRMLGYLASIIAPSIEHQDRITATQTLLFVTKDAEGKSLTLRMQRASIAALARRGVDEVYMRAGVRGDGDRLGVVYRRLGAVEHGSLYKLTLDRVIGETREV